LYCTFFASTRKSSFRDIISGKKSEQLVIEKIPCRADIHGYRREYANALYEEWAGTKYDYDNKNEEVMPAVSAALSFIRGAA
jgi:hypothetical protein